MPGLGTALVTGGATGIGRACCVALAERGHPVAVAYGSSTDKARAVVEEITGRGGRAVAVQGDVADDAEVRRMVAEAREALGPFSVVVNNAGAMVPVAMDDLDGATDEVFRQMFSVNVMGAWYCARATADDLRAAEDGCVVNVGSVAGHIGKGSSLPYAVSKAAMGGLTRSLARALAPDVRVNEVAPGLVMTERWEGHEDHVATLAANTLLGTVATPEDCAATVVALVEARATTGQVHVVDAGQTLG